MVAAVADGMKHPDGVAVIVQMASGFDMLPVAADAQMEFLNAVQLVYIGIDRVQEVLHGRLTQKVLVHPIEDGGVAVL